MKPVTVNITSDFICPWCWIGHRHLKSAIELAGIDPSLVHIAYAPFELNPSMPKDGLDRKAYRSKKFGSWARSQAMDAQVTQAGQRAGVDFNYDNVLVTPNTRLAHRLMRYAQSQVASETKVESLFEGILHAYFSEGQDIGKLEVLAALAERAGFDKLAVCEYLSSEMGSAEVQAAELQAQVQGVFSVPDLAINGERVSGAQPTEHLAELLRAAVAGNVSPAAQA